MAVLSKMIGFVTTSDPAKARDFYGEVLGFRLISEDDFAIVFDANGTLLRVGKGRKARLKFSV
jgi:catechol 2,3-dioxygenase-like lactoylglutathione lyase family enzyme